MKGSTYESRGVSLFQRLPHRPESVWRDVRRQSRPLVIATGSTRTEGRLRISGGNGEAFPKHIYLVNRSSALKRDSRFRCKPNQTTPFVTITATPTMTPSMSASRAVSPRAGYGEKV